MKNKFIKFIFVLALLMMPISMCNAQDSKFHFKAVYTQVDSINIENTTVPTENGDVLVELPVKSNLIIAYNNEHSKAIVLYSAYPFIKHMEYIVKDNETRLVLVYKNKHIYCGFVYDKKSKTGRYFEAINKDEKDKLVKRLPFLKNTPIF